MLEIILTVCFTLWFYFFFMWDYLRGFNQRARSRLNGSEMEIDILAVYGEYAVLIEAKSTLKVEDVNDHIKRLEDFKSFFPEYQDRQIIGTVGGISIEEESDKYVLLQTETDIFQI